MSPGDTSVRRAFSGRKRSARAITAALAGVVVITLLASTSVFARNDFHRVPREDRGKFTPAVKPLGLSHKPVTVVLQMAGAPVTVVDSLSPTGLSPAQRGEVRLNLRMQQLAASARVRALGGTVTGSYQLAYNGIKVRIAREQGRLARGDPERGRRAPRPAHDAGQHARRAADRRAGRVGRRSGFHGEGIKVAVIDTGIDYTHANFGGPGTAGAYTDARADDRSGRTRPCSARRRPTRQGRHRPRRRQLQRRPDQRRTTSRSRIRIRTRSTATATARTSPAPRPAPACSPTAAPTPARTTRPRSPATRGRRPRRRAEGRPLRDPRLRLRGLDRRDRRRHRVGGRPRHGRHQHVARLAVRRRRRPERGRRDNAAKDGVIVVASAGNNGQQPVHRPAPRPRAAGVISVAASDPTAVIPGRVRAPDARACDVDRHRRRTALRFTGRQPLPVIVLRNGSGSHLARAATRPSTPTRASPARSSWRSAAPAPASPGRSSASRPARPRSSWSTRSDTCPPFEGPITSNPDNGKPFNVTIPFLGVTSSSTQPIVAAPPTAARPR